MKKIVAILSLVASIAVVNLSAMDQVSSRGTYKVSDRSYIVRANNHLEQLDNLQAQGRPMDPALRARINDTQQHLGQNMNLQRKLTQKVNLIERRNAQENENPVARRRLDFGDID